MSDVGASVPQEQQHLGPLLHSSLKMSGFETNAVKYKEQAGEESIAQKGTGINGICSSLEVSLEGSLATERDNFTFHSNLVRTSLACLILRLPLQESTKHREGQTGVRSTACEPQAGMCCGLMAGWGVVRSQAGPWKETLPLIKLCLLAGAPSNFLLIVFCPSSCLAGQQEPCSHPPSPALSQT